MAPAHHEPFKALSGVAWSDLPQDDLKGFLSSVFTRSQTIIDSIPGTTPSATNVSSAGGRSRSQTESAVDKTTSDSSVSTETPTQDPEALKHAQDLRKEWKESKVNAKENPRNVTVYKLSAKDGNGAWFARRSLHDGPSFDEWKAAFQAEFHESMKTQGSPGSGNIRGIGADELVEDNDLDKAGHIQVFHLSAQFPGPTTPRDFVTLFLTNEFTTPATEGSRPMREFMVVSRPCDHPKTPAQDGIIRGHYESVELVREVPAEKGRARSSSTNSAAWGASASDANDGADVPTQIEWLMVTRSDPGGSVPRFMIERGTPPGIAGDTDKFIKWMEKRIRQQKKAEGGDDDSKSVSDSRSMVDRSEDYGEDVATPTGRPANKNAKSYLDDQDEAEDQNSGLYSMITGALGAAGTYVAENLQRQFSTAQSDNSQTDDSSDDTAKDRATDELDSDASSEHSFSSALERYLTEENEKETETSDSIAASEMSFPASQLREKELKRLEDRRKKLDDKVAQMQERMMQKKDGDREKDAAQIAKARDKHEKEIAKQEAKYRRELQKIEEKRAQEIRKAEERKRKAEDREKKNNLTVELEKTRTERDIALKQIEILEHQVGELQAQNTMLVAKMGKMGGLGETLGRERSDSASSKSVKSLNKLIHEKSAP